MEIKNNNGEVIGKIDLAEGFSLNQLMSAIRPKKSTAVKLGKLCSIKEDPNNRKFVLFDFETSIIKYSLADKKFYRENGVVFSLHSVNKFPIGKAKMKESGTYWNQTCEFWNDLKKISQDKWLQTFFSLMDIWANGKQNGTSSMAYMGKRERFSRCKLTNLVDEKKFIDCLESLSKIPHIQEMDDVCLSIFYYELSKSEGSKVKGYKIQTNFSKFKIDNWFIERSKKQVSALYDEESVLAESLSDYIKACSLDLKDMFQYVFDKYKGVLNLHSLDKIKELIKKHNYEEKRLADYLYRDIYNQGLEISSNHYGHNDAVTLLYDYANMNKDMNKEFDKYPRYLSTYHDIAEKNYEIKKDQILSKKFAKRVEELKETNVEFKDDVYSIILPKSSKDLANEGLSLNHCVASYYARMAEGETTIVFLRKNEEAKKSLVTIELSLDKQLVQAKGVRNSTPNKAEMDFIKKYLNHLENSN